MTTVFGEVADAYDEVRPGYPDELGAAILAYDGPVTSVVEIGAGTGKGTAVLVGLGGRVTCVEPDPHSWFEADIVGSGLFTDVERRTLHRAVPMTRDGYLRLVRTFSPFLRKSPEQRAREVEVIGATVGETVALDPRTTLVLARRAG